MSHAATDVPSAVGNLLSRAHAAAPDFKAIETTAKELHAELRKLGPSGDAVRAKLMELGKQLTGWSQEHHARWVGNEPNELKWA